MSNNDMYLERSLKAVWHPCSQMKAHETVPLVPISHGRGVWLYDFEGRRYLDAVSSWWVNLFGHSNPRINYALQNQLNNLEHVILAGFTHEPVIELSEKSRCPDGEPAGALLLCVRWRFCRRDRAQDELPLLAQSRETREAPFREP
jgi:adenosylmethionine-8-amino-7-oxononanoate aminotransferase